MGAAGMNLLQTFLGALPKVSGKRTRKCTEMFIFIHFIDDKLAWTKNIVIILQRRYHLLLEDLGASVLMFPMIYSLSLSLSLSLCLCLCLSISIYLSISVSLSLSLSLSLSHIHKHTTPTLAIEFPDCKLIIIGVLFFSGLSPPPGKRILVNIIVRFKIICHDYGFSPHKVSFTSW